VWGPDGCELYYLSPGSNSGADLMAVPLELPGPFTFGAPKTLVKTPLISTQVTEEYTVSPSGDRFLLSVPVGNPPATSFTLVMYWRELLEP
jgi:hypothetical protein